MSEMIPFWEKAYGEDAKTFLPTPNETLKEFIHLVDKTEGILEVGCGEGQNVLYLASQGYQDIDAFDISAAGIANLARRNCGEGYNINAFVCDLAEFEFRRRYSLVMSFATLCFVKRETWRNFIMSAKENTLIGGIHIMHTFTDTVPASKDIAPFAVGLAHEGELKELYGDWEILRFESYILDDYHPEVGKHQHSVNKITARKK